MANEDLKKLRRSDLLELLIEQTKEVARLSGELDDTREKLAKREEELAQSGSITEATARLNEMVEAAQKAAEQYLEQIDAHAQAGEQAIKACGQACEEAVKACGQAYEANITARELEYKRLVRERERESEKTFVKLFEKAFVGWKRENQEKLGRVFSDIGDKCRRLF